MSKPDYDPRTGTFTGEAESKWFVPEQKLNPDQKRFLQNVDVNQQNIWIKGFAGSGKSVLLVHVARKIQRERPSAKMVMVVYTQSLVEMFRTALRELNLRIPVTTYFGFMASSQIYDYILCDEVQDLTPRVLKNMYERSGHMVVAGDSNQSIFEKDPRWFEPTVDMSQIKSLIHGTDFELTIVERLTQSIMNAVKSFVNLNIFGSRVNLNHSDTKITLGRASSESGEVAFIYQQSSRVSQRGYTAAVLIPTQKRIVEFVNCVLESQGKSRWIETTNQYGKLDFGDMNEHLSSCGINMRYVGNGYGKFSENTDTVILMTYHSAKGLDFDYVYMPYCNNRWWISYNTNIAKTLFMVGMTRARMNLYMTYTGYPHSYIHSFSGQCTERTI